MCRKWAEKTEGWDRRASFPSGGAPTPEVALGILLSLLMVLLQATWRVSLDQNRGQRGKAMPSGCQCGRMTISASIAAAGHAVEEDGDWLSQQAIDGLVRTAIQ